MAIDSSIEWTDATWNPVAGCSPVSAGCKNCYAARMALRLETIGNATSDKYEGTAKRNGGGLPVFTGKIILDKKSLNLPRTWKHPKRIFVNSMSDLFHEKVPLQYIHDVFEVMGSCPRHSFQILTKRPERALEISSELNWEDNIWMGTSVEDSRVLTRVDMLRKIPAKLKFLSCEPLIGPLTGLCLDNIDWVIVGGESGPNARFMEAGWVKNIKINCEKNKVPFFFKQWGGKNKKATGRKFEGRTWDQLPRIASLCG